MDVNNMVNYSIEFVACRSKLKQHPAAVVVAVHRELMPTEGTALAKNLLPRYLSLCTLQASLLLKRR